MADSLDIEQSDQLREYLWQKGHIEEDEHPVLTTLTGGVSNRVVLVERSSGDAWVLKQGLEKLRVEVDWFSPPERVHREALGLRWLERLAPAGTTTPLVFEDFDHHVIAMRAVPPPHRNWKSMLLDGDVQARHVQQFAELLGTIHRRSAARRAELEPLFGDRGYFESLRLEPYYGFTATQVPEAHRFLADLIGETLSHRDTIVHGDFSPKNVLVHDDRLVLLDHEVIHLGDPGFDLGFAMTHMLSKAHFVPGKREVFANAAVSVWNTYERIVSQSDWAIDFEQRAVRHTLGCMLARVRGRSPLEYLNDAQRDRQADAIVAIMPDPPDTVEKLAHRFMTAMTNREGERCRLSGS